MSPSAPSSIAVDYTDERGGKRWRGKEEGEGKEKEEEREKEDKGEVGRSTIVNVQFSNDVLLNNGTL